MSYKRILTIQDISCVGQCSLTVALPILSACGHETAILPSAILSTHTAGFSGFTCRDLTEDMPLILKHWQKENIKFDALYTGYLGSSEQISYVRQIAASCLKQGSASFIDPAMADNGKLYPAFDASYVKAMRELCAGADYLLPNITEACFLTDTEYLEKYDASYIENLVSALLALGAKNIVLTGVSYAQGKTGVVVCEKGELSYYEHRKIAKGCHGTGDVYAAAFVGLFMNGKSAREAAKLAADYTVACIEYTQSDPSHWYGVKFEPLLFQLAK